MVFSLKGFTPRDWKPSNLYGGWVGTEHITTRIFERLNQNYFLISRDDRRVWIHNIMLMLNCVFHDGNLYIITLQLKSTSLKYQSIAWIICSYYAQATSFERKNHFRMSWNYFHFLYIHCYLFSLKPKSWRRFVILYLVELCLAPVNLK